MLLSFNLAAISAVALPRSRSAVLAHSFRVYPVQPIFAEIDTITAEQDS